MNRRSAFLRVLAGLFLTMLLLSARAGVAAFDEANRLYEQGKYRDAMQAYEGLLRSGNQSAAVWFNLGNAHYKAGQVGEAVAAYRQAEAIAPRDPDVGANREFAQRQVSGPKLHQSALKQAMGRLTVNEWTLLAAVPLWAWFGLLIAGQIKPQLHGTLRRWIWGAGLTALAASVLMSVAYQQRYHQTTVVVNSRDTVVRLGPFDESPSALMASDGAEFLLHDAKADWYQISDGQRVLGWLKSNSVVVVK